MIDKKIVKGSLEGLMILAVFRSFYDEDHEHIPKKLRHQEADGTTCIFLSEGKYFTISANSELFTLDLCSSSEKPSRDFVEISNTTFWNNKINVLIEEVNFMYNNQSTIPYGLELQLENGATIKFIYLSETEYTFDALVIR